MRTKSRIYTLITLTGWHSPIINDREIDTVSSLLKIKYLDSQKISKTSKFIKIFDFKIFPYIQSFLFEKAKSGEHPPTVSNVLISNPVNV